MRLPRRPCSTTTCCFLSILQSCNGQSQVHSTTVAPTIRNSPATVLIYVPSFILRKKDPVQTYLFWAVGHLAVYTTRSVQRCTSCPRRLVTIEGSRVLPRALSTRYPHPQTFPWNRVANEIDSFAVRMVWLDRCAQELLCAPAQSTTVR